MMNNKIFVISACLIVVLLLLCGCGDKNNENSADVSVNSEVSKNESETSTGEVSEEESVPEESIQVDHTHEYADAWSSNETDHWHECECGDKFDIANHAFDDWATIKEATETETGSKKRTCSVCEYEETATIPMLSHTHDYADEWSNNETDHWNECKCGDKTDLASHAFGEWSTTKEATEKEEGSKYHICSICDYKETVTVPVLSHIHSFGTWKINTTSHWKECNCGEKSELSVHTYGEWETVTKATCTATGTKKHTCTACGYSETSTTPVTAHTYGDWESNATSHWKKCKCGDKSQLSTHTFGEWEIVIEATCTETGLKTHICTACDSGESTTIPIVNHNYISVVTPPTETKNGYTAHTCTGCGHSYVDSYTEPKGHNYVESIFSNFHQHNYCLL